MSRLVIFHDVCFSYPTWGDFFFLHHVFVRNYSRDSIDVSDAVIPCDIFLETFTPLAGFWEVRDGRGEEAERGGGCRE